MKDAEVSDPPSRAWTPRHGADTTTISLSVTGDRVAVLVAIIDG